MTTTLLGVDDSKTMRKVIEITFGGEDFKTVLAENADDAMTKLGAERPSVVLVDAALEGTNGYELCQRIKSSAPSVAVVLLASKQQPYDRGRGSAVGADDFVDKPFDTQQLIDKVNQLLRKQASASAPQAAPPPHAHPLGSTQHGIGPAPQAVVSARPAAVELGSRPRTQTLAYGHNPLPGAGAGPVAPMIPSPGAAAPAPTRSSPFAAPGPARPVGTPPQPAVAPIPVAPPAPAPVHSPAAHAPAVHAAPVHAAPVAAAPAPAAAQVVPAAAHAVATHTNGAEFASKLNALGLTQEQVSAVLALSREVVERVVWEVVPTLAETLIKEEIRRLTSD